MTENKTKRHDPDSIHLTPDDLTSIKAKLADPATVAGLHKAAKRRIDESWELDPGSQTEVQDFSTGRSH